MTPTRPSRETHSPPRCIENETPTKRRAVKTATTESLSFQSLLSWVHRPQAVTKCFISDVYQMRAVVDSAASSEMGHVYMYATRDLFFLDQRPCKTVELVAWVAGVDHKEATMTLTLDDGDGVHVLPVMVRLSLIKSQKSSHTNRRAFAYSAQGTSSSTSAGNSFSAFSTASERRAAKRRAAESESLNPNPNHLNNGSFDKLKQYGRKDIRVGDTVRTIGKVDEWMRRRANGDTEWIRQLVVDENAGGSVAVVDPDDQYTHCREVVHLHRTTYSQPFVLPAATSLSALPPSSPLRAASSTVSFSIGRSIDMSSEAPSELSIVAEDVELRDPTKLRSSQLTDRTFRQYMLDHMTQETVRSLRQLSAQDPSALRLALEDYFPEYKQSGSASTSNLKGKGRGLSKTASGRESKGVFTPSVRMNLAESLSAGYDSDFIGKCDARTKRLLRAESTLVPFTIASLLRNERLHTLARLVVDNEVRKEERRSRRRIRDGSATDKDLRMEAERKSQSLSGLGAGVEVTDQQERRRKMERLVSWAIRAVAEEGSLVQIMLLPLAFLSTSSSVPSPSSHYKERSRSEKHGYLPLPPELLFPLCIPHLQTERFLRENSIIRKTDPRYGNGMNVDDLTAKLRRWGEDGRWERLGDWIVEESVDYAAQQGWLKKFGNGWWLADGFEG